jgi:hypothetical protein
MLPRTVFFLVSPSISNETLSKLKEIINGRHSKNKNGNLPLTKWDGTTAEKPLTPINRSWDEV